MVTNAVDEMIVLGTGTSGEPCTARSVAPPSLACNGGLRSQTCSTAGSVPIVGCLTASPPTCPTCTSTAPENTRLNTCALFRIGDKNLLVDCGKTFYNTALRWFPHHGLRRIDALLLTHAHADAYFGLDDLRQWTLGGFVQDCVDVYCTRATLDEVARTFPYLVDKAMATGGGDVAEFRWHTFDEARPFTIQSCGGVEVTPLPVEHGRFFKTGEPFWNMGFRVGPFSYIGDCSRIPDSTTALVKGSKGLVIDGLRYGVHPSHFGIEQARQYVRDMFAPAERPRMTWMTGFSHAVEHFAAIRDCEDWAAGEGQGIWIRPAYDGMRVRIQDLDT